MISKYVWQVIIDVGCRLSASRFVSITNLWKQWHWLAVIICKWYEKSCSMITVCVITVTRVGDHSIVERLSSDVCRKVFEAGGFPWWWATRLGTWSGAKGTTVCRGKALMGTKYVYTLCFVLSSICIKFSKLDVDRTFHCWRTGSDVIFINFIELSVTFFSLQ